MVRDQVNMLMAIIILSVIATLTGCRDREEPITARYSTPAADEALKEAEAKLQKAGVPLSFDDPGNVMHPENLLPDPETLKDSEKQRNFEAAIDEFNIALEEIEREFQDDSSCPVSDRALLHLHLGLVYVFDALSRFLISDEEPQTFIVKRSTGSTYGELYTVDVTPETKAKLNAAKQPEERLLVFTASERQGIMDLADLVDDAVVKPTVPNIQPQFSSVNRPPYSRYAIWHLQRAAALFGQYDPKIQESIEDFNKQIDKTRAQIQERSESWGFSYTLPPGR